MIKALAILWVAFFGLLAPSSAETPAEHGWVILQQAVQDPKGETRASAVHALGILVKDERAMKLAETALADPSPDVRAAGAAALGQIDLPQSIPKLKKALKDSESEVV
ncbi:MAG: HEAT repeat domain-containing protein, partial [Vicinamibacteria bacterium]